MYLNDSISSTAQSLTLTGLSLYINATQSNPTPACVVRNMSTNPPLIQIYLHVSIQSPKPTSPTQRLSISRIAPRSTSNPTSISQNTPTNLPRSTIPHTARFSSPPQGIHRSVFPSTGPRNLIRKPPARAAAYDLEIHFTWDTVD